MQSFRERSGFHGNQHCYQQEPQELSRLESYRHHHSQSRQGYEPHSLAAAGLSSAGAGSKDCYGQQTYPVYTSSSATQTKKTFRGAKTPSQHMQAGYSNHMGPGYTAQYISEGHLQQKWDESAQMTQFEQDMVGRLESGVSGSSQYLEQNMLAISQSQCHLPSQSSATTYTSSHQQGLPPNPAPSPLMYPQGHLHFPQHSQPPSSSSSYMEKCNTMPHGYKGYGIPTNAQYGRQLGNHSSLKQSGYRPQNNYGYQQTPSRSGFEQGSLQGMSGTQENLQKFQHYNQPQQNYCITDISVRSPEQYYQTCSPSSSHSPARSVGRSPSYNSTPSPLMPNPDSFQYGQPPINPGASSSSSLQDQNMLMPPNTHSSPSVNHQSQSYSGSMKERFSEKLLSNPSLWSLNALTSQVENISNNVQQLLLSEALMANKKTSKRNPPKKGEDYRGQLKGMEESSCPDNQHGPPPPDAYSIPRSMTSELQEGGYSSSTEDQMDRSYYYFGQDKGQAHTQTHPRLSLDTVSTCSLNSADDVSVRSGDSVRSLQSVASEDNLNCDPRVQRVLTGEEPNSSLRCIRDERSPISVTAPSPMKQESNSPPDIKRSESTLKENFEESAWTERMVDEEEIGQRTMSADNECKGEVTEKQEKWLEDEKSPSIFHKINKAVLEEGYSYETNIYHGLQNKYSLDKGNSEEMDCFSELNHKCNEGKEIKSEHFKSEPQATVEMLVKTSPNNSGTNLYLPDKEENSKSENSVDSLTCTEGPVDTLEEQSSVFSHNSTEVRDEKENLTTTEEVINNRACTSEEMGNMPQVNTEPAESFNQDAPHRGSERRSAICDIAPQPHTAKSGFSTLSEKTTPLAQARDHHIDRSDAKVLEPDSPQLPGKSILHSAPSWADTPPSPKKGDEDMEPGISCPSAVTPSAKPEPLAPSEHTRMFGKKHARGRRRPMHSSVGIRRQLSVEGDSAPPSAQNPSMPSSKSALIPDQMETAHQNISSQTQKLVTESLPSRMCTRSYGSQSSPKVCPQERRKPGPKPGPKPGSKLGVKPGPKPGPKSGPKSNIKAGPKPSPKSISKPGPKPSPKPEVMPSVKTGPKISLKCTGSTKNAKPGPKPGVKPGPKPGPKSGSKQVSKTGALAGEILVPKPSQTTSESKPIEGSVTKGPGRPRGITSKIKSIKRNENIQIDHTKDTKDHTKETHELILQDVSTALTTDTLVSVVDNTKDETVGSTLESTLESCCVKSLARDQKSMVLRSRKQTKEKLTEDKESDKSNETTSEMLLHSQIQNVTVDQSCKTESSNLELPKQKDVSTESLQEPNEEIVSIKRKYSLPLSDPKKRKKVVQEIQVKTQQPPLDTVTRVCIAKGKRKRGQHLQAESVSTTVTVDNPPTDDISDMASLPPQCPTKTKYLPPRKGRGLKYEAMVQKITSPGSKKQPLNIQPDIVPDESTSKSVPQAPELKETMNAPEVTHMEAEITSSSTQEPQTTRIHTPRKKRRTWATIESSDVPDVALEAGSLVINTPRLAKQRAIKNNHEMHLKQRKKRRKGTEPQESTPIVEKQEPNQTIILPPPPPSLSLPETGEQTQYEEPPTEFSLPQIKPKRGRRPSLKKKQEELSSQTEDDKVKEKKKSGPKKKVLNVLKVVVRRPKIKTKCSNDLPPTVKGTSSDLHLALGDGKCSFRPYVHIDRPLELASLCTIINRPEEEQMLSQARKKSAAKMKNLVTVTKAVSNSSVMLQGPLVNKSLIERCLTCCLCGKPANYRELGDLCGPYYPEDCIPRKMLSSTHRNDFRQNSNCANETEVRCIADQTNSQSACAKDAYQDSANEGHSWHPRRGKRAIREPLRTRPTSRMRFKRLLLLQSRLGGASPPAGEEGSGSALQRLQMEAEAKEHWAHEACAVWTTGIILVAGKLFGLKEAVQKSANTKCSRCQGEGASICCSWKSCTQRYHYVCAKEMGCTFQEETFSVRCPDHKAL
ncbi:retinoic acid-induced protein 1 [Pimephales promelas]|uniref:retinoic acid-induced protein 1 n=1 Tax=Pimephales promelas TaxID=90988 RepID=UPI001955AF18|nr:retinoic acid-induced protein 1 [Pimephales promelas]KAG1926475.1 retinoic acid-induced protein [Pimephales promelas]